MGYVPFSSIEPNQRMICECHFFNSLIQLEHTIFFLCSFEDLALSQFTAASANNTSISAVEFLACCRSALTFFPSLASADGKSDNLSNLGSLQTVYAEVLADVVRLELAVKTLANVDDSTSAESARQRSLALSLADIVNAEIRAKQTRSSGSAYLALLWLSR